MSTKKIATAVLGTVLAVTVVSAEAASGVKPVQCYGIAPAHKNDCGTPQHACAGTATVSNSPNEWIFEPTAAACQKAGGTLKPGQLKTAAPAATKTATKTDVKAIVHDASKKTASTTSK